MLLNELKTHTHVLLYLPLQGNNTIGMINDLDHREEDSQNACAFQDVERSLALRER